MNTAREIVQEIIGAGGHLWFDGDRVRGRNIPRRLAVLVKADEGGILAALLSAPAPANYAIEERLAIQEESAEVSDLPDKPVPSLEEQAEAILDSYGADWQRGVDDLRIIAKNHVLAALVEKMGIDATQPARVDSEQDMPTPERVTCGQCVRFQPGTTKMGIGVCLATANGLPPAGRNGDYKAAYPNAPRSCPEYR
ncbi:MAG: hypothetical protein M0003_00800, partial [Acidithiobacillus sp.]|nr:hypothetical protein [Acidithiobacillus sp.]